MKKLGDYYTGVLVGVFRTWIISILAILDGRPVVGLIASLIFAIIIITIDTYLKRNKRGRR